MLECPDQQHADRHFAPGNCVLGCTKVTLTEDCSMSVLTPLEWTQRPLRVKSRPHGITQTLCPLYPRKRTSSDATGMSALCGEFNESAQHLLILADEEVCEWRGMHGHGSRRNRRLSCGSAGR